MAEAVTPQDLEISPRNLKFARESKAERWWAGGDPISTAWYNALSVTFPAGETFFIESVRRFEKQVPEQLALQIKAFVKQEAFHTREHNAFNARVKEAGYDIGHMEAEVQARLDQARETHPVVQLGLTTALEHFTAIFAHSALKQPELLNGADREAQRMWGWHAIEEIEHKAVAFDIYRHATRDVPKFKRWMIRSMTFLNVSRNFITGRWREALDLLEQDGIIGFKARWKLAWLLWGKPGLVRRVFLAWLAYFRPGFHPWQVDDRALIADAQQRLDLV
ncbi:metal-dependent hydrolase [Maricaulis sp. MIT060901]|uniref:metal-dependent hydrolase n=1 Tax=Maricaulis sp. MIT060901 TaxID=3096993 RepID=UPI00399BA0BF